VNIAVVVSALKFISFARLLTATTLYLNVVQPVHCRGSLCPEFYLCYY
jgi:hypothetical protein